MTSSSRKLRPAMFRHGKKSSQTVQAVNMLLSGAHGENAQQSHQEGIQDASTQSGDNRAASASVRLWNNAVREFVSQLSSDDQQAVKSPEFGSPMCSKALENILSPLRNSYEQSKVQKLLQSLQGALEKVRSFTIILEIALQACPNPAALIWSALRVIFKACSTSLELAESMCGMLDRIGKLLAHLEQWANIFPLAKYVDLSQTIEKTYYEYILFLVSCIKYFRRPVFCNVVRGAFSQSLKKTFEKSDSNISELMQLVVFQVQTASLQASATRDAEIKALLGERGVASTDHTNNAPLKFIQNSSQNNLFFGRGDVLDLIHQKLDDSCGRQRSVSLHGLPGVGKSQIGNEYLWRHYNYYPIIILLDCGDRLVLETQFAQIARQLRITVGGDCRSEVLSWIAGQDRKWLLIFDNVDDLNAIRPYWPAAARGSILITSRNPMSCDEGLAQHGIRIDPFTTREGADFVISLIETPPSIDRATRHAALELSDAFGGLPLGIKIAVSTMAQQHYTLGQFTRDLKSKIPVVERQSVLGHSDKRHPSLSTLFDMVLQCLDLSALYLLDIIAFLDPNNVPVVFFDPDPIDDSVPVMPNFRSAAHCLCSHSLLRFDDKGENVTIPAYLHSLVYRKLLSSPERCDRAIRAALELLNKKVPELTFSPHRDPESWPEREKLLKHVLSVKKCSDNPIPEDCAETMIKLLTSFAYYFYETGLYRLGHEILGDTEALIAKHPLMDPMILSRIEFTKAKLFNEENEPSRAETHWREALRLIKTESQGSGYSIDQMDSQYLSMAYSGLGVSLTAQGRFADAALAHDQAHQTVFDLPRHVPTRIGTLYTNMGSNLLWKGQYDEAEKILGMALQQPNRLIGGTKYALANVYLAQGLVDKSFAMHKNVLELFEEALGHRHHCVADSCIKVGTLFAHEGNRERDLDQAQTLIQEGLNKYIYWSQRGQEDMMRPYIARAKWKLAQVLEKIGEVHAAEVSMLKTEARAGYVILTKKPLPATPEAEDALDKLVFFWSR